MGFRVGQKVRIVKSAYPERLGRITTVISAPFAARFGEWTEDGQRLAREYGLKDGTVMYKVDEAPAKDATCAALPGAWLEPYDDGREPAEWTEELRRLCGVKREESA
ncbi:MAG TPA: hypothetical protein VFZ53_05585 [Polyangiaceae bacterium]